MLWTAVQTQDKEFHVYPLAEKKEHIMDEALCNCMPEATETPMGRIIMHQKFGSNVWLQGHWVGE